MEKSHLLADNYMQTCALTQRLLDVFIVMLLIADSYPFLLVFFIIQNGIGPVTGVN